MKIFGLLYFFSIFCYSQLLLDKHYVNEGVQISISDLDKIEYRKDLTFDHPHEKMVEVYGPEGFRRWLDEQDIRYSELPKVDPSRANYPSSKQIERKLKALHAKYPTVTKLFSIGKSVNGQDLWVMKISDNPQVDELEPEFIYISSMHGNEITGREVMVRFIERFLADYQNADLFTQKMIHHTEIFIMPSMNPDGSDAQTRGNANFVDLNRDFPDFTTSDNLNSPHNREPETAAVMKFQDKRHFALSANFHGGAEVVNYPWDTKKDPHSFEQLIVDFSLDYAREVPYIYQSNSFPQGITNGWDWYEVDGGMQDWSTYWYNNIQVTVEISDRKWPDYSQIPYYFKENYSALLKYMANIHQGIGVKLLNFESGDRLYFRNANSYFEFPLYKDEFYTVLPAGIYDMQVRSHFGQLKLSQTVVIQNAAKMLNDPAKIKDRFLELK